jgi:hypothetical protein
MDGIGTEIDFDNPVDQCAAACPNIGSAPLSRLAARIATAKRGRPGFGGSGSQ